MGMADTLRTIMRDFVVPELRGPKVPPKDTTGAYAGSAAGSKYGLYSQRKSAQTLRRFSERDVWVRTAINRRKREIARAEWAIVRVDDPHAQPNEKLVKKVTELFTFVNDRRDSLSTLLATLVEDILVIDAGVVEKEKTYGGQIAALWPVAGEEVAPDPTWDGSKKNEPRYYQVRDGKIVAKYTNDELVYIMANPRSNSAIGLSPLEVLFETVEADLYGQDFEYEALREVAPSGLLYLGGGMSPAKVEAFRAEWEMGLGFREVAIVGGGGYDPETGSMSSPPSFIPFGRSARDEMRREYMRWLATKVAAAFEMDLLAFNLSEAVHKSIGGNLQAKTDEGLLGLAGCISQYITREIIWEIDDSHTHGFQFQNLTRRDAMSKALERQVYMNIGCTTPNEIRKEDGKMPVEWGDEPWPTAMAKAVDPAQEDQTDPDEDEPDDEKPAGSADSDDEKDEK